MDSLNAQFKRFASNVVLLKSKWQMVSTFPNKAINATNTGKLFRLRSF